MDNPLVVKAALEYPNAPIPVPSLIPVEKSKKPFVAEANDNS